MTAYDLHFTYLQQVPINHKVIIKLLFQQKQYNIVELTPLTGILPFDVQSINVV